jgi:proteic killer suppression protein
VTLGIVTFEKSQMDALRCVRRWHRTDMPRCLLYGRYRVNLLFLRSIEIAARWRLFTLEVVLSNGCFENDDPRGISGRHVERIRDILPALGQAIRIDYMNSYPGWRLHPLKGELRGFWSVSVSGNWRDLSFRQRDGV